MSQFWRFFDNHFDHGRQRRALPLLISWNLPENQVFQWLSSNKENFYGRNSSTMLPLGTQAPDFTLPGCRDRTATFIIKGQVRHCYSYCLYLQSLPSLSCTFTGWLIQAARDRPQRGGFYRDQCQRCGQFPQDGP